MLQWNTISLSTTRSTAFQSVVTSRIRWCPSAFRLAGKGQRSSGQYCICLVSSEFWVYLSFSTYEEEKNPVLMHLGAVQNSPQSLSALISGFTIITLMDLLWMKPPCSVISRSSGKRQEINFVLVFAINWQSSCKKHNVFICKYHRRRINSKEFSSKH